MIMHLAVSASVSIRETDAFLFEVTQMEQPIREKIQLSEKEEKLIRLIRELKFGELRVMIADSQPVRLEEVRKSIKL